LSQDNLNTNKMSVSKSITRKRRAQAMVEFMLALPFLLLTLYGTIEVARIAFIFTSASNASRAAARYAAASGDSSKGIPHYKDCEGIKAIVNQSAYIAKFTDINITYDRGVNPDGSQIPISGIDPSPSHNSCPSGDLNVRNGDRVIVQVSTEYEPIISIVPIKPLEIVSASAHTFLVSIPILGSALPTGFFAESSTPSRAPTKTRIINTPMASFTLIPTNLPTINSTTIILEPTKNLPPSKTFTPSRTPYPTGTPTITPTAISCTGLSGVGHGQLIFKDNYMEMNIFNNTNHILSTAQLYVEWNYDNGHQSGSDKTLRLRQITLGEHAWEGDLLSPSKFFTDFYPPIPQGGSTIRFIFHQTYEHPDGTERIILTIGTPGCINYPIDSSH
jgi:hypothetical protein